MKAVLFDFGGTLDTNGIHWCEKFWEVYQKYRIQVTREDYVAAYVAAEKNMNKRITSEDDMMAVLSQQVNLQFEYLQNNTNADVNKGQADAVINSCYVGVIEIMKITEALLKQLRGYYKLGVVSNFYGNLESVLKGLSIEKYFDAIVDSAIVNVSKPDPGIFRMAIKKLNTEPEKTYMVGDSYDRDIQPAKRLGCYTIWLDGKSWQRPAETPDADLIIHSINNLADIIVQAG